LPERISSSAEIVSLTDLGGGIMWEVTERQLDTTPTISGAEINNAQDLVTDTPGSWGQNNRGTSLAERYNSLDPGRKPQIVRFSMRRTQ
jgi:hypothetical protein